MTCSLHATQHHVVQGTGASADFGIPGLLESIPLETWGPCIYLAWQPMGLQFSAEVMTVAKMYC